MFFLASMGVIIGSRVGIAVTEAFRSRRRCNRQKHGSNSELLLSESAQTNTVDNDRNRYYRIRYARSNWNSDSILSSFQRIVSK